MRRDDLKRLETPYEVDTRIEVDRRFHASIGADVPSANNLARQILNDLDETNFGVSWWTLPEDERILVSDYLYQCIIGIETNLVEAKLHYLEWLDARDRADDRIADVVKFDAFGSPDLKMPPSKAPIDDLPHALESLHICGFFRAIGSSLDCLGAAMIGVLALKAGLRRSDIASAEKALHVADADVQKDFLTFYLNAKNAVGVTDWFEWTDSYRNMLIHRGRLIVQQQLIQRENPLVDAKGKTIIRTRATTHLSKSRTSLTSRHGCTRLPELSMRMRTLPCGVYLQAVAILRKRSLRSSSKSGAKDVQTRGYCRNPFPSGRIRANLQDLMAIQYQRRVWAAIWA